ncbi:MULTISPECIES: hypothetical protein [Streptacidiphilus]|uniref:Uncharacterized protein n=1 Tax=Streptacidiphilus cavernicola TaxID=3342716 RepID=A0ABV6UW44_9ACTN|nr:hypothetical protein [Streptacidiphilus jeojiense]
MSRPEPPCWVEALAVYGWAVQHGGLPLAYAADVLADHGLLTLDDKHSRSQRLEIARQQLQDWEDALVWMEWPGDDAIDRERWDQGADWELREGAIRSLQQAGLPYQDDESTNALLSRYASFRAAQCRARARLQRPKQRPGGVTGPE